jgi:hypothetical protein
METRKLSLQEITALSLVRNVDIQSTEYRYNNFEDFLANSPQRLWPGFRMDSYSWSKENMLYIVYKKRLDTRHITCPVRDEEDAMIRVWLRENMCVLWRLL